MTKHADITRREDQFFLQGELDFSNVMSVYLKSMNLFSQHHDLVVDFSGLRSSNSSGLALIVEWIKYANDTKRTLRITHLSPHLQSIAEVSGIDKLIPITL